MFSCLALLLADQPAWMDVLVDILLSLLGRSGDSLPFGPLREACEALFRAFVDQVTPQGFNDMVRVVQQTAGPQPEAEEDEEVFEEEEEVEAEAEAAGGGLLFATIFHGSSLLTLCKRRL